MQSTPEERKGNEIKAGKGISREGGS